MKNAVFSLKEPMIQELIYTSARKGIQPGTRGFCTVAHTRGMNSSMIRLLESLSAYGGTAARGQDVDDRRKTVSISHYRAHLQHRSLSIISRISATGNEHTNRDNKIAHHIVLDCSFRPSPGPAELAGQLDFYSDWHEEPCLLDPRAEPPLPGHQAGGGEGEELYAQNWEKAVGDPGWAGFLSHHFRASPNRPIYLVYEPGMAVLPLLAESLKLLPADDRWFVTFNTCFMQLPAGLSCLWRCCPANNPHLKSRGLINNSCLTIDLTRLPEQPPAWPDTRVARGEAEPVEPSPTRKKIQPTTPAAAGKPYRSGDTVRITPPARPKNKLRLRRRPQT